MGEPKAVFVVLERDDVLTGQCVASPNIVARTSDLLARLERAEREVERLREHLSDALRSQLKDIGALDAERAAHAALTARLALAEAVVEALPRCQSVRRCNALATVQNADNARSYCDAHDPKSEGMNDLDHAAPLRAYLAAKETT